MSKEDEEDLLSIASLIHRRQPGKNVAYSLAVYYVSTFRRELF